MNIIDIPNSQLFFSDIEKPSAFQEKYTFIREIGKGTYSTVYLSRNSRDELVAVKQYAISDQSVIEILEQMGSSADAYIKQLAQKELEVGRLTDHPHIIEIKEVFFESPHAYVVMNYVEGKTLDHFESYSVETRLVFVQQLLSAIEHLLLRNIIIDDLWSGNILISDDNQLILLDLGGYEIINHDADMPLEHYLEMIESTIKNIGGNVANTALEKCKFLLPKAVREEIISPAHIRVLVYWIEALQKELSRPIDSTGTFYEKTFVKVLESYTELQGQYPDHISFCTAQHSNFLAYSLIAMNVLQKFNPGACTHTYLENILLLRYPFQGLPKSLEELFRLFPVKSDYDASSLVGNALISVSPSLKEAEREESARAIFENNERKCDVADYIAGIFESEHVSPAHFHRKIKSLVKKAPKSKTGLIYNFFIPKDNPLHKAIYLSQPYGIPIGDPLSAHNVSDFYNRYRAGLIDEKSTQLRFLPSALIPGNNFTLEKIKSYRFTTIPQDELKDYAKKIKKVVDEIFKDYLEEMLLLAALASDVETRLDSAEKQRGYHQLCYKHLCRHDVRLALYYRHKLDDQNPRKIPILTGIIACLLKKNQWMQAYHYFQRYENELPHKDQLIARFALIFLEQRNQSMLNSMLTKPMDSDIKNFILFLAGSHYPEYECPPDYFPDEMPGLMSYDDLIDLAYLSDE